MRLLLDTHALWWWWLDDPQLSRKARKHIADQNNEIFISAASAWEIATKHRLGKLELPGLSLRRFPTMLIEDGFKHLAVTIRHGLIAGAYPQPHRDPFDRMLAAQAEVEGLAIISRDSALKQFGVKLLW